MERDVTEVVAALIWRGERFLICQRPENKARGLLWEFVGGKVERGESREDALRRECREELALNVEPKAVYAEVLHEYPDLTVRLTIFHATAEGEPTLLEHRDLRWITPAEIPQYDFCPADSEILLRMRYEYAKKTIPSGRWRHFKGGEYEVLGVAKHSETLEPMVVYRAKYGDGEMWTRPAEMWNETVTRDGKQFPRFAYEGESRENND